MKRIIVYLSLLFISILSLNAQFAIEEVVTTNVSCNGSSDGSVTISVSGGVKPYVYRIFKVTGPPPVSTNDTIVTFTNVEANNWTVVVQDDGGDGVVLFSSALVTQPSPVTILSETITPISCTGYADGEIAITAGGESGSYIYTLAPGGDSNATGIFPGLSPDNYTVTVTDASGCSSSDVSNILPLNDPAPITINTEASADVSCNGAGDGSVTVTALGGTGSYTFTLNPGALQTNFSGNFGGLDAGIYTVNVTDVNACPSANSNPLTVNEPPALFITSETSVNSTCNGADNGSISVTAAGGNAPYIYTISPGGASNGTGIFENLAPGDYTVDVNDSNGCGPVTSSVLSISEPAAISIDALTSTDLTCHNANDGSISISASGGNAPLNYTINPGGSNNTTGNFGSLSAGIYTIDINDAEGCPPLTSPTVSIDSPDPISITGQTKTDVSCNGLTDGEIVVTATGGTGTLEYTLNPGAITNTTGVFDGLAAGTYNIGVSDENACAPANTGDIDILEPGAILATVDGSSQLAIACNGDNSGSINITVSGGNAPYFFNWTGPDGFNSSLQNISGLAPGTYQLEITDNNGCNAVFPALAEITEPPALTISLAKTDVTCNGDANGTITVTAGGGTPPYQYSRNGISYQGPSVFNGLIKNLYRIYVKDANDCIISDTISISEPEELQVASEIRVDNNQCYGDSLGEIRILSVTGGVEPFEYSINGGADFFPTSIFLNLPAGTYQTMVRDANGCTASGNLNLINQPPQIRITNYAQLDVTDCFGNNNGQIAVEATGGTGTKYYSLDGGAPNTSGIFNSVTGGPHTITITDVYSCYKDTIVLLDEPDEIIFSSIIINDVTGCPGAANATVSASATGGTGVISYAIDGGTFQATGDFSGLGAGPHTITARDANDCLKDTIINISEPEPIVITGETATDASCAGYNNGSITITVSGGTAPYSYTLNPGGTNNSTGTFTNLAPDTYTVEVNDSEGCGPVISSPLTISEPEAVTIDSLAVSPIICSGENNAQIHIYASGGTSPYQYSIDDQANWYSFRDFTGLTPDTYYLSLKDANNCLIYIDTITFDDPAPLTVVTETSTDVLTCYDDPSGSLEYSLSGGSGLIEYSIDNGASWQSSGVFPGLTGGDYTVMAEDERGCTKTSGLFTIDQPAEITADISSTAYLDELNKGTITISNPTGGTGTLEFSIYGTPGTFGSDTHFTGLDPDTYHVVVKDANNCTLPEDVVVDQIEPLDVTFTLQNMSCHGELDGNILLTANNPYGTPEYSIDDSATWHADGNFSNLPPGQYILFARDPAGRYFSDTITLYEPTQIGITAEITQASCSYGSGDGKAIVTVVGAQGSPVYLWSNGATTKDLNDVDAGTYTLEVTDSKGCTASSEITIPPITTVTANAGADTSICYGTSIQLNGQGGTSVQWSPAGGLSNPDIFNPVVNITEDAEYILRVEGLNDCYDLDTIRINVLPFMNLSAGNDTAIFENEEVEIELTGGPFTDYSWDPVTGVDDPTSPNVVITPSQSTVYIVSAVDTNGCVNRDTLSITIVNNLIVYNAFSPNDDGVNDYWDIDNAFAYPDMTVEVFARWGERLFSSVGYTDDKRWDGTYKGKDVPIGTYYYVIIPYKGANTITGTVTIVR